jgi:cbb3-type cytochrome oxidase maturation protein
VLEYLALGEFLVAVSMGLAALCAFVWGAATGAFTDVESVKHQVLEAEGAIEPFEHPRREDDGDPPHA